MPLKIPTKIYILRSTSYIVQVATYKVLHSLSITHSTEAHVKLKNGNTIQLLAQRRSPGLCLTKAQSALRPPIAQSSGASIRQNSRPVGIGMGRVGVFIHDWYKYLGVGEDVDQEPLDILCTYY